MCPQLFVKNLFVNQEDWRYHSRPKPPTKRQTQSGKQKSKLINFVLYISMSGMQEVSKGNCLSGSWCKSGFDEASCKQSHNHCERTRPLKAFAVKQIWVPLGFLKILVRRYWYTQQKYARERIGYINSFPSTHPDWKTTILLFSNANVPILKATSFFQNLAKSSNQFHQNTIHALKGGWLVEIFLLLHQSRKCKYDSSKAFWTSSWSPQYLTRSKHTL